MLLNGLGPQSAIVTLQSQPKPKRPAGDDHDSPYRTMTAVDAERDPDAFDAWMQRLAKPR